MLVNRRVIIFFVLAFLVLGGFWTITYHQSQSNKDSDMPYESSNQNDALKFSEEYHLVEKNNRFKYSTANQILDIFDKGSGIIFLGFPSCPWCQQIAPMLDKAAKESRTPVIYYLNIHDLRQSNDKNYEELVNRLRPYLRTNESGEPKIYVPDITAVHQGKIVGRFKQEQAGKDEEISSPEEFWNGGDGNRRDRAIQQLKKIMNLSKIPENPDKSLSSPGIELIDVRTPQEFSENHIKGAKNITLDDGFIQNVIKDRSISKSTPIYLYCRSGNRSYQAARQLIDAGYINIYDLGGINDAKQLLNR